MTVHQFKKGMEVIYWDENRENPIRTRVTSDIEPATDIPEHRSKDWAELYGFVCKISESEEKIPIDQLDPVSPGSLLSASLKGLKNGQKQFQEETKKFFNENGVEIELK